MDLRQALGALKAGWWLLLVGLVAGGAVAGVVSLVETPRYTSDTQLFVSTTDATSAAEVYTGSQFAQQRVTSYAQLLTGPELASRVIARLNLAMSVQQVSEEITATPVTDTVLIDVAVTDSSPQRAQAIADAVGSEFIKMSGQLERTDAGGLSPVKVTVTQAPELPRSPSSPETVRNVVIGVLAGLVVGAGFALVRARLDRSVKTVDEASEMAGAPVLGLVQRDEVLDQQHVLSRDATRRVAEDYRQLRTNLQYLNVDDPPKVIMISSALPSEGKSTLVANLALALAEVGRRVLVVEGDLRRPRLTRYLGLVGGVGLTNILAGTAELDEVVQKYGSDHLSVIAAGPTPPNPGDLLASTQMASLLDKLRGQNDFVLVDSPPLLPVADSTGLAALTDGVVISVRYGTTHKEQLEQAAASVRTVGAEVLGVVMNIVPPRAQSASAYGYGYKYEYGTGKS